MIFILKNFFCDSTATVHIAEIVMYDTFLTSFAVYDKKA